MNSEQRFHSDESRIQCKDGPQIDRHQPGLPVMAVQDIRAEDTARNSQRRAGEHSEAHSVIRVIGCGVTVIAPAIVKGRTIEQVKWRAGVRLVKAALISDSAQ